MKDTYGGGMEGERNTCWRGMDGETHEGEGWMVRDTYMLPDLQVSEIIKEKQQTNKTCPVLL